jgi:hypothetical protein
MSNKKPSPKHAEPKAGEIDPTPATSAAADYDPKEAEGAYQALLPRMQAASKETLTAINVDLQEAAITALSVARFIGKDEPKARFALLPAKAFDHAHAADLRPLALGCFHAQALLRSARTQTTEAKLPVELVDAATEVKTRMIKVCKYHFEGKKKLMDEVDDIVKGTGYKDLSNDLVRLAKLYEDNPDEVEHDKRNYRAGDAAEARRLAAKILDELGAQQSAQEKAAVEAATRVWALLRKSYLEVQAAGLFLWRHEDGEAKFPSLHASSGSGRPRKDKGAKPAEPPPADKPADKPANG